MGKWVNGKQWAQPVYLFTYSPIHLPSLSPVILPSVDRLAGIDAGLYNPCSNYLDMKQACGEREDRRRAVAALASECI